MSFLDDKPASAGDRLWCVTNRDGTREITDEDSKAGRGGFAPPINMTYREAIADMVQSLQRDSLTWLEIYREYLKGKQQIKGPLGQAALPGIIFVANSTVYTAYIGTHHEGRFLGFGGRKHKITMTDGTEYESNNVWYAREVPPDLRGILADNATMKAVDWP